MKKTKQLLSIEFESSTTKTPQYLEFYKTFKREFTNMLKPYINNIKIHKPNHFDVSGFFERKDNQIFYFSLGDLRWNKKELLIRTATDFKDYTGGRNNFIPMNNIEEEIKPYIK